MELELAGKVVLITGGSEGIGYARAEAIAAIGALWLDLFGTATIAPAQRY